MRLNHYVITGKIGEQVVQQKWLDASKAVAVKKCLERWSNHYKVPVDEITDVHVTCVKTNR